MNILKPVVNYATMLDRIFWCTFAVSTAATWFLRQNIPNLNTVLSRIDWKITVATVEIPACTGYLIPGLLLAVIFRVIKMHDRISDLFGIRRRFDIYEILSPLAGGSGLPVDFELRDRCFAERHKLMSRAFYAYATSTAGKEAIDRHLIETALDWWSWRWVFVEATAVTVATGILVFIAGGFRDAAILFLVSLMVILAVLPIFRYHCKRCARAEVEAILAAPDRIKQIREVILEVSGGRVPDPLGERGQTTKSGVQSSPRATGKASRRK